MKNKNPKKISQNIKKYRLMHNMTQEDLAGKLYLDTQYYAQLERGERNFTIEKIIQICSIFRIGIEHIIEIDSPQSEDLSSLLDTIDTKLQTLNYTQLAFLDRFITEMLPFIK